MLDNWVEADPAEVVVAVARGTNGTAVVAGGATTLPLLKLTLPKADETVDRGAAEELLEEAAAAADPETEI